MGSRCRDQGEIKDRPDRLKGDGCRLLSSTIVIRRRETHGRGAKVRACRFGGQRRDAHAPPPLVGCLYAACATNALISAWVGEEAAAVLVVCGHETRSQPAFSQTCVGGRERKENGHDDNAVGWR